MTDKFYVTTPIYYVNDKPHLGHAYTTLMADVFARFWRNELGDDNVFFLTGTDEHGAKVAQSAEKKGMAPQAFADEVSAQYQQVWEQLGISYDEFFRTTDPRHATVVQTLLTKLYEKGLIYKASYKGIYCIGDEKFLSPDDIVDGKCPHHPNLELREQEEENYFFKLKEVAARVAAKLEAGEYQVIPDERRNEMLGKIRGGIEDISISRAGVAWGIPVPWDPTHTVYVWVDALINYYSATQFYPGREAFWPASLHLMAKDILWFHAIIWEALLEGADLPYPHTVFAHGFFTVDGQKMSKTIGNVVDPVDLVAQYGRDGARYLLISAFQFGKDGDISLSRFKEKYNSDLANGIGNMVARVAKLAEKLTHNPVQQRDESPEDQTRLRQYFEQHQPDEALRQVMQRVALLDQQIAEDKPWTYTDQQQLTTTLAGYLRTLHQVAHELAPFMPDTAEKIQAIVSAPHITKPEEALFQRQS